MAKVEYSERAFADLERLLAFVLETEPEAGARVASLIEEGVSILKRHPYMGRPVKDGLRELVISRGRTGYIARYRVVDEDDVVFVLAIRHRREAGFLPG